MVTLDFPARLLFLLIVGSLVHEATSDDDDEGGGGMNIWHNVHHTMNGGGPVGVLGSRLFGVGGGVGPLYLNRLASLRRPQLRAAATLTASTDDSREQTAMAKGVIVPGASHWWSGAYLPGSPAYLAAMRAAMGKRLHGFLHAHHALAAQDDSKEAQAGVVGAISGPVMLPGPLGFGVGRVGGMGVGMGAGADKSLEMGGAAHPKHDSSEEVNVKWKWDLSGIDPGDSWWWGGIRWGMQGGGPGGQVPGPGGQIPGPGGQLPGLFPWFPMLPGFPPSLNGTITPGSLQNIPGWMLVWLLGGNGQQIPPWLTLFLNGKLSLEGLMSGRYPGLNIPPWLIPLLRGVVPPGGWKEGHFPGLVLPPWFIPLLNGKVPSGWKSGSYPGLSIPPWLLQWLIRTYPPTGSGRNILPWLLLLFNGRFPPNLPIPPWFFPLHNGTLPPGWAQGRFPGINIPPWLLQWLIHSYPPSGPGRKILPWLLLLINGKFAPAGSGIDVGNIPPWLLAWILRTFPPNVSGPLLPPWLLPLPEGPFPPWFPPTGPSVKDENLWLKLWYLWLLSIVGGGNGGSPGGQGFPWWLLPPWIRGPNQMPPREPVCRFPAEIVASLDGSAGVHPKDFSQAKMALLRSVDRLCMEDGSQRLGAIVYGSDVTGRANLMGNDRELKRQIGSFRQPFGASNTAAALKDMDNIFHFAARPGVPKFGVVMTTGNSQNAAATARQAAQAKASGVRLLSLGLGARQNFRELAALASHPNLVFQVPPFFPKDLALYNVLKWICWLAGHNYPPPQTTTPGPPTWSSTPRATPPTPTPGSNTTPRTPTPGTPTPTPTPTAPPTPSVQPPRKPDLCEGSRVKDGVEYNPHPTDCDKHVQCVDNGDGTWQVSIVQCPHGLLWDQSRLICNFPDQVNCDICLDGGVTSFPASAAAGCRAFWECMDGVAVGRCCPEGWAYSYLAGGCLPDPACMDDCNLPVNNGTVGVCDKRAVSGLPSIYEQQVIGVGWVRMPCPAGTQYSAAKCGCVITKGDNSSIFDCKPEIYLPFTMGTEDRSGNSYFIHNDGVKVNNGVAYFDGNAVLRIPRFANSDFGTTFLMDIRYRRDGGGGGGGQGSAGSSSGASGAGSRLAMSKQALVSNGDCGKEGSLFVSLGGDAVNFGVRTRNGVVSAVSLPSQWDWQNAVFRLDDRKLTGTVNGKTDSAYVGDIVERSNCALQIGRGTGFDNFKGYIDELTVYLCEN